MRLAAGDVTAIKAAASEAFGPDVVIRLFGSRTVDQARGGDIDLHFEMPTTRPPFGRTCRFLDLVEGPLDGRKVDTVFSVRGETPRGFEHIPYRDGIIL